MDPDLLLDEPTKLADTLDQIEQTLRSCKLHHAGRNYLLDLRALALELKRTGGWGHVTACFWRLVLPPAEEGDSVVHWYMYMLYTPPAASPFTLGRGGLGRCSRRGASSMPPLRASP